jgi:hypothetical protein
VKTTTTNNNRKRNAAAQKTGNRQHKRAAYSEIFVRCVIWICGVRRFPRNLRHHHRWQRKHYVLTLGFLCFAASTFSHNGRDDEHETKKRQEAQDICSGRIVFFWGGG